MTVADLRPSAEQARVLAARLRTRLAGSFAHLHEACAPHVALDAVSIAQAIADIAAAAAIRPEIYVLHHDLVEAARHSDLSTIGLLFAELPTRPLGAPPGPCLRSWGDASFAPVERDRFDWAFCLEGDTPLALVAPARDDADAAAAALRGALDVLARSAPELAGETAALVTEIVLAGSAMTDGTSFDGVSTFWAQGAVVLNAAENSSLPGALATLVHEAAHTLLFAVAEGGALVENDPEDRFPSPLRQEGRPMNGVFHATFVSARMAYALNRALSADALPPADRPEAAQLLAGARAAFVAGLAVVQAHGRLTETGAAALAAATQLMARSDPSVGA